MNGSPMTEEREFARAVLRNMRVRAGSMVGRMQRFVLAVNAHSASEPWIRELCRLEIERRKELES